MNGLTKPKIMEVTQLLNYSITLLALIAASLAWIAKLRWSKEYKEAKEAQIDLLKEKLAFYENMTSPEIFDFYKKQKEELEGIIKNSNKKIDELSKNSTEPIEKYNQLKDQYIILKEQAQNLQEINMILEERQEKIQTQAEEIMKQNIILKEKIQKKLNI